MTIDIAQINQLDAEHGKDRAFMQKSSDALQQVTISDVRNLKPNDAEALKTVIFAARTSLEPKRYGDLLEAALSTADHGFC